MSMRLVASRKIWLWLPLPHPCLLTCTTQSAAFFMEPSFEEIVDPRDIPSCCPPGQVLAPTSVGHSEPHSRRSPRVFSCYDES